MVGVAWRRAAAAAAGVMADSDDEFYDCDTDTDQGLSCVLTPLVIIVIITFVEPHTRNAKQQRRSLG